MSNVDLDSSWRTDSEPSPDKRLFQAILATALQDALGVYNGPAPKDAREARAWIGTDYFYDVCRYAGREPEEVLRLYRAGELNASQKPQGNRLGRKKAKLDVAA